MDFNALQIDPIAFSIAGFPVRWYALAYLAGFLLGWKYCIMLAARTPEKRPNAEDIDDFLTWAVIGVILNVIFLGYAIYLFATLGTEGIMNMNQDLMEQYN